MTANFLLTRRSFLAVPAAAFFAQRVSLSAAAVAAMKDAYRNAFLIGTALDFRRPDEFTPEELELITSQFNVITPENSMKPGPVHPQEDTWNWTQPDALVSFCETRDQDHRSLPRVAFADRSVVLRERHP